MKVELDIQFSEILAPTPQELQELTQLRARCKDKDGFEPGIHSDTGLNALRDYKPWLLAKAFGEDGNGRIAGAACVFLPTKIEAEISACVDPLFRSQGVFAQLFKRAIASLRDVSVQKALLVSDARLRYGQAIAAKLGIVRSHTEKTMSLELTTPYQEPGFAYDSAIRLVPVTKDTVETAALISSPIFNEPIDDARTFIRACVADPSREPLLAIGAGGAVGVVSLARVDEACMVHGLGVVPDQRGQGYGGAILDNILIMLRKRGLSRVTLEVDDQNSAALALYESRGFTVDSLTDYWLINLAKLR